MLYNTQEDWERDFLKDKIFLGEDEMTYLSEAKIINDDDDQNEAVIGEGFGHESLFVTDLPAEWGPPLAIIREQQGTKLVNDTGA